MDIYKELWEKFNNIRFNETNHSYTDNLSTKYTSVTGFIKQFVEPVDWDTIKIKYAEKHNISVEEVTAKWKYTGDYHSILGTTIHSVMENLWYNKNYVPDEKIFTVFPEMKEDFYFRANYCETLYSKLKKYYIPIKNEMIVYDQPNALCGTIDFLAYNKVLNRYAIIDWKTSKSIDTYDSYNIDKKLKDPFANFNSCNFNEYSLQLSTYAWIIEKNTNIKIDELIICQIPGKQIIPVTIKCNDLRPQLSSILK